MKALIVLFFISSFASVKGQQSASVSKKEDAAVSAAQSWLQLVDNNRFDQSWDQAAEIFKARVSKADWNKMLQSARTPFGKLLSRKLESKKYTTTAPGAPDGEYVIIKFETSFENKKSSIETITPALDKDGHWHVSGYFIK